MLRLLSSGHYLRVISWHCCINWQVNCSCCRARADRWEVFTVQAKRDRKTLDFTCVLTENHHNVNLAVLDDLSRNSYIDCEQEVHLYMAVPGKLLPNRPGRPLLFIMAAPDGQVFILQPQAGVHMHAPASVCFLTSSTLASTSLSSESQATYLVGPVCTMRMPVLCIKSFRCQRRKFPLQPLKREGGLGKCKKGHCAGCLDIPIECCREEAEKGQSKAKALRRGGGEGGANRGGSRQLDSAHPPAGRGDLQGGREHPWRKPRHTAKRAPCSLP